MASTETLESISLATTVEMYLDHRRDDARISTLRKQRSALRSFVDWAAMVDIEDMNDLDGRRLMEFKTWCKRESDLNTVSLNGNLAILRRFLVFCERIEAVVDGLPDRVPLPNVPKDEEVSDRVPSDDAVMRMRDYFAKFEYASRRQSQLELITEVGLRLGAVRSIDLWDLNLENKVVHLRHRPEGADEYGTPLKNGADGERNVNLSTGLANTIQNYIDHNRHDVDDQYERAPLFTSP